MNLGAVLASLRREKGIYQKDLASYLHLSVTAISNYENGTNEPTLATICRMADYFGVTTDYLLGRTDQK